MITRFKFRLGSVLMTVFLISTMYSCLEYECDGFPDSYLKWVPYKLNDTIKYYCNNDTIEFAVIDYSRTEPSSGSGFYMDYECTYKGYYKTNNGAFNYRIKETCSLLYQLEMFIEITESDKFCFDLWKKKSFSDSVKLDYIADTTINSVQYQEVFLASKDTATKQPNIAWVMKAKDKGIIRFYDYKNKQLWSLVEK